MKHRTKRRLAFWIIISVLLILFVLIIAVLMNIPKAQDISDSIYQIRGESL